MDPETERRFNLAKESHKLWWKYCDKGIDHLPPGHVDRVNVQKMLEKEYGACIVIERKWRKRLNPKIQTAKDALKYCNDICDLLGERRIKKVVVNSEDVKGWAGAHYSNKEIHFKFDWISFTELIHELAHHFNKHGSSHGKEYCEMLEFIFKVAYIYWTGKQPKKDW